MKFCHFGPSLIAILLAADITATSAFTRPVHHKAVRDVSSSKLFLIPEEKRVSQLNKTPSKEQVDEWLSQYGEESRKYRRDVFTAADWVRTRRPERFQDNIKTTFLSGLVVQIAPELTLLAFTSTLIVLWNVLLVDGYKDFSGVTHGPLIDFYLPGLVLPLAPFSLSTASLGLLLTFRTNVSYGRWNQARTAWGKVINDSRSIMRMACIWAKSYTTIEDYQLQRLGEAVCSFSRSLMNRTLPPQEDEENYRTYLKDRLTDQTFAEELKNAKHRPTASLAEITATLVDFRLNPLHQVEVEKVITGLCDALGASERIFTSPVPTFYTRHTARFLAFWLIALPTGLYDAFKMSWNHWTVVPVTLVIGGFLLGIEELATQMEEPFSILPMEKMSEGSIRTPVMEQVERSTLGKNMPTLPGDVVAAPAVVNGAPPQQAYAPPPPQQAYAIPSPPAPENVVDAQVQSKESIEEMNARWARMGAGGAN